MLKRIIQTKTDVSTGLRKTSSHLGTIPKDSLGRYTSHYVTHISNARRLTKYIFLTNNNLFQNDADLLAFQEELEEDEEARKNVNIYRDPNKNLDSDCEEDIPRIDLAEMMEMVDLNKNDEEMPDLEG